MARSEAICSSQKFITRLPLFFRKWIFYGGICICRGFYLYTCANGGLHAHETIEFKDSCLGSQIYLEIPWPKIWEASNMCLDYIGDDIKGAFSTAY